MSGRVIRPPPPEVRVLGQHRSTYLLLGWVGWSLAVAVAAAVLRSRDQPASTLAAIVAAGVAAFLVLAMLTRLVVGREILVAYHHKLAVMGAVALVASLRGDPVPATLDAAVLGTGAFLAVGRIGCLAVGCCYGRPGAWGVHYGLAHVRVGFPSRYAGVRLVPVQLAESLWVATLVGIGLALVASDAPPGVAAAGYVAGYGVGRFHLESLRGDPGRPHRWGFSEAQWLAVLTGLAVALIQPADAGWLRVLGSVPALSLAITAAARRLRGDPGHRLLGARHLAEVADALDRLACEPAGRVVPTVERTSQGLLLSSTADRRSRRPHYGLSGAGVTPAVARRLARAVVDLRHPGGAADLLPGVGGVHHLLVGTPSDGGHERR